LHYSKLVSHELDLRERTTKRTWRQSLAESTSMRSISTSMTSINTGYGERRYHLIVQLIASVKAEEQKTNCAAAWRWLEHANSLIVSGDYDGAMRENEKALDRVHDIPEATILVALCQASSGLALFQLERHDESQRFSRAALPVLLSNPDFANDAATCLNNLGASLLTQGKAQESVKDLEDAIQIWSLLPGSDSKIADSKDNLKIARRKSHETSATPPSVKRHWWKIW